MIGEEVQRPLPPALADLDFELPPSLIADRPLAERDACRLLVVRRQRPGALIERVFRDLPELLQPNDVLVRNVARVLPARLAATKEPSGGRVEILLLEPATDGAWWALLRPSRRLPPGTMLRLDDGTLLQSGGGDADGRRLVVATNGEDLRSIAARVGRMPLPPYVERPPDAADATDYQTVYASRDGSVASPTAGLHFTPALFERIRARGVRVVDVVLHVGLGTFQPIRTDDWRAHRMHWERFEVDATSRTALQEAAAVGARIVAIGTTVTRVLESIAAWEAGEASDDIEVQIDADGALRGRTRLFLHPPYDFRRVGALVTNFHLPRTTLLLLVRAFAGEATTRAAYAHAVHERFRFFSYGDAMWIE